MKEKITLKKVKAQRDSVNCPIDYKPFAKVSPYLSYLALKLNLKPNQITLAWGFLGILSFVIMSFGGYWNLLIGMLVFLLAVLLDFMDGEMARVLKAKDLVRGTYLDFLFSNVLRGLLVLGLGIGLYNTYSYLPYLYLGIWSCMFLIVDNLNKLKIYEAVLDAEKFDLVKKMMMEKKSGERGRDNFMAKIKFYTIKFLTPNNPLSLMLFVILFNISEYYLILLAVISPILFFKNFISIYMRMGKIKEK